MPSNVQGGKTFGLLKEQQRSKLEEINKEYLEDQKYRDEDDLADKLEGLKNKYAEFDLNDQGEIGDGRQQQHHQLQGLCQDDAGQAFSCAQTDKANGTPCKPDGPPPKRDIASLP
ncbi:hypothetical protein FQN60_008179 [Etheostoma spectabile]|uniref:Allograft inflammatory factor 1-like EF-hand domain-containing protein n=1 Tax=Etheostoma spectabile TaxID=54343 RepID=A0A5J5CT38_9PERO|nr:hypothetical protein FQN60_008179 [Etheostoma spectabile]